MLGTAAREWGDFALAADPPPADPVRGVWADFVRGLPAANRKLRCSEMDYQAFLLRKYGTLAAINAAQGLSLARIEEAFPPFADAYAVTFARNEWSLTLRPLADNYRFILAYNGWEWALIICQKREMWTLSVWMYQANQLRDLGLFRARGEHTCRQLRKGAAMLQDSCSTSRRCLRAVSSV